MQISTEWRRALGSTKVMGGRQYLPNVPAKSATNAATQKDISSGASHTMADPVSPPVPRNVKITVTDGDVSITAFTVTVTGKDQFGKTISEVFVFAGGLVQVGVKVFAELTSIVMTSLAGNGASDTLDAGWDNKIGLPVMEGASGFAISRLLASGTAEAVAATDTTWYSFTPTTVPDGVEDYEVQYRYTMDGRWA